MMQQFGPDDNVKNKIDDMLYENIHNSKVRILASTSLETGDLSAGKAVDMSMLVSLLYHRFRYR